MSRAGRAAPPQAAPATADAAAVAELRRRLAARDKVIAVLKRRVRERDHSAASPLATLQHNVALGRVVAMKTRELSEERHELQRALTELGRTQAALLQAQKMESVGQLAAGIAHEINTPAQYVRDNVAFVRKGMAAADEVLAAALAVVEAARGCGGLEAPVEAFEAAVRRTRFDYVRRQVPEALEQSLEGLDRISRIVGAMKQFSHPSAGEKERVDLRPLVETAVTVARNEWKYVAQMEQDFAEDVPEVSCLRDEIGQVLLNLVVNAAHAISDSLVPGQRDKGRIAISVRRFGDRHVDIRVADDGPGIPEAIRTRVFDPFFTTKPVGKGTGQGLAMAYSTVVDKHGGALFFETGAGPGTTFVVRLPIEATGAGP
ncbi:ATP-binding protein [Luteimonas sp. RD2P54]|uniref:histidine kinase n=1 Tax=Luteimonas endophytica TaxID=3042023 RepID=A0ABT6J754_9GAMM|nr:ATP-binding protein [Luteimonas endophytica]MDH5822574.1 ATP-binding protein [Luteimonas endophytica]